MLQVVALFLTLTLELTLPMVYSAAGLTYADLFEHQDLTVPCDTYPGKEYVSNSLHDDNFLAPKPDPRFRRGCSKLNRVGLNLRRNSQKDWGNIPSEHW